MFFIWVYKFYSWNFCLCYQNNLFFFQHLEEHPADWPDMKEVLPLVGIQDSSLDYKKAVADWLKAREESS